MKKLFVLMLILCFVASSAQAYNWSAPAKVATRTVRGSIYGQIAAEDGKLALADGEASAASTWPSTPSVAAASGTTRRRSTTTPPGGSTTR